MPEAIRSRRRCSGRPGRSDASRNQQGRSADLRRTPNDARFSNGATTRCDIRAVAGEPVTETPSPHDAPPVAVRQAASRAYKVIRSSIRSRTDSGCVRNGITPMRPRSCRVDRSPVGPGYATSTPAERRGDVGQDRFHDMRIVFDAELIGDREQQRVGCSDRLVLLELFDERIRFGDIASTKN